MARLALCIVSLDSLVPLSMVAFEAMQVHTSSTILVHKLLQISQHRGREHGEEPHLSTNFQRS